MVKANKTPCCRLCRRLCKRMKSFLQNEEAEKLFADSHKEKDLVKEIEKPKVQCLTDEVRAIITIQSFVKGWKVRRLCKTLLKRPSIGVIQKFAYLVNPLDSTFLEELEIIQLKDEAANKMSAIQLLKEELNARDKHIGSLVTAIRIQESRMSQISKRRRGNNSDIEIEPSIDRDNMLELRNKTEMLESYQHLFYYLQTQPKYLSKLICEMSPSEYTTLGERLLHRLYNHASTLREEYHLVKFLKGALQYEIDKKCYYINDILRGSSMAVRTVFSFYRQATKFKALLKKLTPVIKDIIEFPSSIKDKPLVIREMTNRIIASLCLDTLPYGIKYVSKVLKKALHKKTPQATRDKILGTLGLFMYQYIQPVIEAPHDFGLIENGLPSDSVQRQNLMSVSTLLCHTMSNNLFSVESDEHALTWNLYIVREFPKFRHFLDVVFKIPEPEEKSGFNHCSDMIALKKPVIDLPAVDIVDTHALLIKYNDVVFPDKTDIVYKIFQDLGPIPHVKDLIGEGATSANRDEALKTEICLSLSGKYILQEENDAEMEALVVITKKLLLDVIRVQSGESLLEVLMTPASAEQEEEHEAIMKDTTVSSTNAPQNKKISPIVEDHHLPLEIKKEKIIKNLKTLDKAQSTGLLKDMGSKVILNTIAKNISRKRELRLQRQAELMRLRKAVDALDVTTRHYEAQLDLYKIYEKNCLEKLVSQLSSNTGMAKKNKKEEKKRKKEEKRKIKEEKKKQKEEKKKQKEEKKKAKK